MHRSSSEIEHVGHVLKHCLLDTPNIILVTPAQITILEKLYCCDSVVLQSLARRMHQVFLAVCSLHK